MVKFIIYSLLSAACLIWLSQNNGFIHLEWLGYEITVELIFLIPIVVLIKICFLRLLLLLAGTCKSRDEMKKVSAIENVINGLSYLKIGDNIAARNCIAQAKKIFPDECVVKLLEVNHYISQRNLNKAKKILLEIIDSGSILSSTALHQMLKIAYREGDLVEAENIIQKTMKLFPKENWALLKRGEFYCRVKKYEEALFELNKVRKLRFKGDDDLNDKISILYYAIAEKEYQRKDYNKALKYLNYANSKKMVVGSALLQAKIYCSLNKRKKSLNILEYAHQSQPHQDLIRAYIEYGGDINKLSSISDDMNSAWQCTACYKKIQSWNYICNHCDELGTIRWL